MIKLYFDVSACSLSPHIVLREAGLDFELEWVDLKTLKTATGADFTSINPKGYVPVLQLDDGQILTEGVPMVQYIADLAAEKRLGASLIPPVGSIERYRVAEWLTFTSSELHRGFTPLFSSKLPEEIQQSTLARLHKHFEFLENHFSNNPYLVDDSFTVADAYCFTILNWAWAGFVDVDLEPWPNIRAYIEKISARPKVQEAMAAEQAAT